MFNDKMRWYIFYICWVQYNKNVEKDLRLEMKQETKRERERD